MILVYCRNSFSTISINLIRKQYNFSNMDFLYKIHDSTFKEKGYTRSLTSQVALENNDIILKDRIFRRINESNISIEQKYLIKFRNYLVQLIEYFMKMKDYRRIFKNHSIEEIFLSTLFNIEDLMLANLAMRRGIKISFFDEGLPKDMETILFSESSSRKGYKQIRLLYYLLGIKNQIVIAYYENYGSYYTGFYNQIFMKDKVFYKLISYETLFNDNIIKKALGGVFLMQTVVEDGIISLDELEIAIEIVNEIDNLQYIKFHPRQAKYVVKFVMERVKLVVLSEDDKAIPFEVLLENFKPSFVVGFFSSSLLYLSSFSKIPTYTVIQYLSIMNPNNKKLNEISLAIDKFLAEVNIVKS